MMDYKFLDKDRDLVFKYLTDRNHTITIDSVNQFIMDGKYKIILSIQSPWYQKGDCFTKEKYKVLEYMGTGVDAIMFLSRITYQLFVLEFKNINLHDVSVYETKTGRLMCCFDKSKIRYLTTLEPKVS